MLLPKDPYILLSFLNARLRDQYADLEDLCASLDADERGGSPAGDAGGG